MEKVLRPNGSKKTMAPGRSKRQEANTVETPRGRRSGRGPRTRGAGQRRSGEESFVPAVIEEGTRGVVTTGPRLQVLCVLRGGLHPASSRTGKQKGRPEARRVDRENERRKLRSFFLYSLLRCGGPRLTQETIEGNPMPSERHVTCGGRAVILILRHVIKRRNGWDGFLRRLRPIVR